MSVGPVSLALGVSCALAGAISLMPRLAHAQPSVEVLFQCPALDSERQAAVEARVRADLLVRRLERGRLAITCSTDQATAEWRPEEGVATTETARLADPSGLVDLLLALALRATTEAPGAAQETPGEDAKPAEPPPTSVSESLETGSAHPPAAAPPARRSTDVARQDSTRTAQLSLSLGASAELWRGDLAGALGPRLGIGASWEQRLGLGLVAGVQWTPQQSDGVSAAQVELAVEGRARAYGVLWLNGALGVSDLLVFTRLERTDDSDELLLPTGWAGARAAFDLGGPTISVGPELRAHLASRLVRVNGRDVFTVPAATVGLVAELTLTP